MSSLSPASLLVPGFDAHLPDDLAVAQLERLGPQHADPVRVLAGLSKRYAVLPLVLALDAVGHLAGADVAQVLGDLLLAPEHLRGTGGGVAVDRAHLGVVGVEADERIGVAPLDSSAQGLEIQTTGCLGGHGILLPPARDPGRIDLLPANHARKKRCENAIVSLSHKLPRTLLPRRS